MSFHGLPRYSIELGDPYYRDCMETARLLSQRLSPREQIEVTFQSRFGAARWLEPYTEPTLNDAGRRRRDGRGRGVPGFCGRLSGKPWRKSARNAAMPSSRPAAGSSATFPP